MAADALRDPLRIDDMDTTQDYCEDRSIATAMAYERNYSIVYTERGDQIRIISARLATRNEQNNYYPKNGK